MSLSDKQIAEAVAKVGKPRRAPSPVEVDVQIAQSLLEAGFSWPQVGKYFGCSGMTVRRRIAAADEGRTVTPAPFHIAAALAARGIHPKPPEADPGPDLLDSLIDARLRKREEA